MLRPGSCTLRWLYTCLCNSLHCLRQSKFNLACLLQNSTGILAPFETFLWLAPRRGPIFRAAGLHAFCFPSLRTLHVVPGVPSLLGIIHDECNRFILLRFRYGLILTLSMCTDHFRSPWVSIRLMIQYLDHNSTSVSEKQNTFFCS